MENFSRREFLTFSISAGTTLAFSAPAAWAFPLGMRAEADPHFFLQLNFLGGVDPTYLFDARPLAMTQAGKQVNYSGVDPQVWTGQNGQTTLATSRTDALKPFAGDFSVLNGVLMSIGFDGHDQNMNYLFTGSPFGGESFISHLNLPSSAPVAFPLDCIQFGTFFATLTNLGSTIPVSAGSALKLVEKVKASPPLNSASPFLRFLKSRYSAMAHLGDGRGKLALGAAAMQSGLEGAPGLASLIQSTDFGTYSVPENADPNDETILLPVLGELIRKGLSRSAYVGFNLGIDTHAPADAKKEPEFATAIATKIANVLRYLKTTPYDQKRSLLDVTTFMVSSEFSRTMRQPQFAIDATGTDHNPLNNSILVGGKGVKGGLVVGQSDYVSASEKLSGAHLALDPVQLKLMGRPFDFDQLKPQDAAYLPSEYLPTDYLGFSSVANTLYSLFGVSQDHFRTVARNGPIARTLNGILS